MSADDDLNALLDMLDTGPSSASGYHHTYIPKLVFNETEFRARVDFALQKVRTVLENSRVPQCADKMSHQYDDKFRLAESLVNTFSAAMLQALSCIGLSREKLAIMREWAKTKAVSLRFAARHTCKFKRKVEREVQSDTKSVTKLTLFGKNESYTVTKVTEYFWQLDVTWEILAFSGSAVAPGTLLISNSGSIELKTSADKSPRPETAIRPNIDVRLPEVLLRAGEEKSFSIDRSDLVCQTPRRNVQVEQLINFARAIREWGLRVNDAIGQLAKDDSLDPQTHWFTAEKNAVFIPILPLFEQGQSLSSLVPPTLNTALLAEQQRTLNVRLVESAKVFPANGKLVTHAEAKVWLIAAHIAELCEFVCNGLDFIERMLYLQLVAAIGNEEGMSAAGVCLCNPSTGPEGLLSIQSSDDYLYTFVSQRIANTPMKFSLGSATEVSFFGERYLHGAIKNKFAYTDSPLFLNARARQFSSFIVLLGTIGGVDLFIPRHAFLVQNKDEFKIPLNLETIPTAKEFRDAIESLSPEMQRFAKAYRSMQLESTLFGVCVIQIKPQLERLLNLDADSLAKQINMTQDILKLIIEYQIPSDQFKYTSDGWGGTSAEAKVAQVSACVERVKGMIESMKLREQRAAEAAMLQAKAAEEEGRKALLGLGRQQQQIVRTNQEMDLLDDLLGSASVVNRNTKATSTPISHPTGGLDELDCLLNNLSGDSFSAARPSSNGVARQDSGFVDALDALMASPTPKPLVVVTKTLPSLSKQIQKKPQPYQLQPPPATPSGGEIDYTTIPRELERKVMESDITSLRPTIITVQDAWKKQTQKSLLSKSESSTVETSDQSKERTKAFDLLDALTRSGSLPIVDGAELHVVIVATHCFDKSLIDTVIQDNINPIEKVERSSLIVASSIQQRPPAELIVEEQVERIAQFSHIAVGLP